MGKSFSFSKKPRNISLSSTNNPSLTGHLKKYHLDKNNVQSRDETTDHPRSIKLKQQPNSNRILNPNLLDNYHPSQRSHSFYIDKHKSCSGLLSQSNNNPLTSYEKPKDDKGKKVFTNSYRSFNLAYNPNESEDSYKEKRCSNKSKFDIYKNTTQIYGLPGGIKREIPVRNRVNKINENAINMKMQSDFSSKVECLPGSMTREVKDKYTLHKKMVSDGGVNKESSEERNEFRKSRKNAVYGRNAYETFDKDNMVRQGRRTVVPDGVKDQFKSQFALG